MHVSTDMCLCKFTGLRTALLLLLLSDDLEARDSVLHFQRESQNNNAFESVFTFQDLDVPDAQRIRGLESLLGGSVSDGVTNLVTS